MEVELIKAHDSFDGSARRKISVFSIWKPDNGSGFTCFTRKNRNSVRTMKIR